MGEIPSRLTFTTRTRPLMKVFASLFAKSDRPTKGAQPLVAPAGAKPRIRRFFVLFFASLHKKERRELPQCKKGSYLCKVASFMFCTAGASPRPTAARILCEKTVSVLFDTANPTTRTSEASIGKGRRPRRPGQAQRTPCWNKCPRLSVDS